MSLKTLIEKYSTFVIIVLHIFNSFPFNNHRKVRGKGNQIINQGAFLRKCRINISGNNNIIKFGKFNRLFFTTITVIGNNNVIDLSEYVYMNKGDIYIEDSGSEIIIGNHTTFAGETHLACIEGTKITVGARCLFSSGVVFRTGDSHSILNMEGIRVNPSKDISIGEHVWVGNSVTILKGVNIERDTIIGTGSIVTKSCSVSNVILAGNPAKIIKSDINWENDRI